MIPSRNRGWRNLTPGSIAACIIFRSALEAASCASFKFTQIGVVAESRHNIDGTSGASLWTDCLRPVIESNRWAAVICAVQVYVRWRNCLTYFSSWPIEQRTWQGTPFCTLYSPSCFKFLVFLSRTYIFYRTGSQFWTTQKIVRALTDLKYIVDANYFTRKSSALSLCDK